MKRLLIALGILLSACAAPTPELTLTPTATATATETETPTPTLTPTPARPTAFSVSLTYITDYLATLDFTDGIRAPCTLDTTPVWAQCTLFGFYYNDDLGQAIEVIHEGDTVFGVMVIVYRDIGGKNPDVATIGAGTIELSVYFRMPFQLMGGPIRDGDFYYIEGSDDDLALYAWFDYRLAEVICANPLN